jgi:transposase
VIDSTHEASAVKRRRLASAPWTEDSAEWQRCDQQVPADHVARRIVEALKRLDLSPLFDSYSGRGTAAVDPKLLLTVALIEKHRGRQSPAQWFRDLRENIVLQWAGFGIRPSRSVCYEFRDRLGSLLDRWNKEVVGQAIDSGVTDAAEGAIDGSTIAACASRHRLLNQERLTARIETLGAACEQDGRREPVEKKGPGWRARPTAARSSWTATGKRPKPCGRGWRPTPGGFPRSGCRRIAW